jgi:cell division transport system permease protein
MILSQPLFVARRAARNLRDLFWTHLLTCGTMATTLFVFGAVMLLEVNLQVLVKGWGDSIHLNAYLDSDFADGDADALARRVGAQPEILRVRYISRSEAWRELSAALGAQSAVLEGLPPDVLPASLEIAVKPAFREASQVQALAARLEKENGISLVEYPRDWIDRLSLLVDALAWLKWIFAGVLFVITFFIVSSAVRLSLLSRRDEIEIMQLVGASRPLIQAPFIHEAMIQGIAGGALAVLALWGAFETARAEFTFSSVLWGSPSHWRFLAPQGILTLVILGWALGSIGGFLSVRRHIRKWRPS